MKTDSERIADLEAVVRLLIFHAVRNISDPEALRELAGATDDTELGGVI